MEKREPKNQELERAINELGEEAVILAEAAGISRSHLRPYKIGVVKFAELADTSVSTVRAWITRRFVSGHAAIRVEENSGGQYKATLLNKRPESHAT